MSENVAAPAPPVVTADPVEIADGVYVIPDGRVPLVPNVGIVTVPDPRLDVLRAIARTTVVIPAAIEFVDIAGLVKGASQGEGLGNKFLTHIREVDAIVQVVRCFEDEDVHHVAGSVDPVRGCRWP